jgi:uncharacterized repeat protein (TIGR01451 family)
MKSLQTKTSKFKGFVALILSCAVLAQMFTFALPAQATSPRFNFLQGDWELLRGANRSQNQTDWSDPVSGQAGETFAGIVYYHNGMIDTTAKNTKIKVTIPALTQSNTAVLNATVSADNAPAITDTVIDGKLEGKSGLTVNLNEEARLSLVPGSVKWFPNYSSSTTPSQALPLGQTGDEIITSGGLNIGDINGCWPYIGYVTFLIKTEKVAQPQVAVDKTVRNVTIGETNFVKSNYAKPGDVLEYRISVSNSGNGTAENLYLTDAIPANTSYVAGSTVMSKNGAAFASVADGITGDGISIGNFAKNDAAEIKFRVKVSQGVASGETLTNVAHLHVSKEILNSTAKTIVKFGIVTPPGEGNLPVTGANGIVVAFLVALSAGFVSMYLKYRKSLKSVSL